MTNLTVKKNHFGLDLQIADFESDNLYQVAAEKP
jgi:hypothetical protein